MASFHYKAARPDGTVLKARMDGDSEAAVRSLLEQQGLLIFSLEGPGARKALPIAFRLGNRLSLREFLVFNQEFLALVKSGLPVLRTFDLLAERAERPGFKACLQEVRKEVRGGAAISEAMGRHPSVFSDLYRASLRSGEQTGNLVEVLQRYIAYLKLVIAVREKVIKALAYPAFLIVVGAAVVLFLLLYVMPTFAEIYGRGKTMLPLPTRMLLAGVEQGRVWLPWMTAGTVGGLALLYQWARTASGRARLDWWCLRLPLIGDVLRKNQVIRMARTLATVLAGGIPLLQALQITSSAITNREIAQALVRATARVREGASLAASLKQEGFLPSMTLEMIDVGETTGALESMLLDVAEFHEGELDLRLSQLTTWIEPVLLLMMGVLVGGIVIIMYLPVFQLAGSI
jgi:type IV pilus assembly protein PilC